jgi:type IV fimbrial biogenesis protein FimT
VGTPRLLPAVQVSVSEARCCREFVTTISEFISILLKVVQAIFLAMNTPSFLTPEPRRTGLLFPQRPGRGFTLLELLVAMVITAILLMVAAPSMAAIIDSMRLTSAANSFVSHLYMARSEAIKRNNRVALCKSADGVLCTANSGWEQGWVMFQDTNDNGILDSGEPVIVREQGLMGGLRMTGNQSVAKYVSFTPTGATKLAAGGFQAGTLTLCHPSKAKNEARQIVLNAAGRPRVQTITMNNCI